MQILQPIYQGGSFLIQGVLQTINTPIIQSIKSIFQGVNVGKKLTTPPPTPESLKNTTKAVIYREIKSTKRFAYIAQLVPIVGNIIHYSPLKIDFPSIILRVYSIAAPTAILFSATCLAHAFYQEESLEKCPLLKFEKMVSVAANVCLAVSAAIQLIGSYAFFFASTAVYFNALGLALLGAAALVNCHIHKDTYLVWAKDLRMAL